MGVPSFYKWLTDKYPNIISNTNSEQSKDLEFDNLYLDMNGIIHPCFHPEGEDNLFPPTTFEDVFSNMYDYIGELFDIVRPRKLLYMAIDGVAPRAKMNQQRSRRFRTAKDNEVAEEAEKNLRRKFESEGKKVLTKEESELSDPNIITPGTEFMHLLSKRLQDYIKLQMTNDSRWSEIKVILSDANVPGEGEHKIMSFIRAQRSCEGYNPNTRHCLYGLDADLIMLALATHEVHFSILREDVLVQEEKLNAVSALERSSQRRESHSGKCRGWFKQVVDKVNSLPQPGSCYAEVVPGSAKPNEDGKKLSRRLPLMKKPFQYLHVWILREYLNIDLKIKDREDLKMDLERIIDDFIFICFFTGNDFLPHMPTLEIHEGAIDLLIHVYKEEMKKNPGGYLVDVNRIEDKKGGYIKLKTVQRFILAVGEYEEKIFKKRSEIREKKLKRIQSELLNSQEEDQECMEANLLNSLGSIDDAFQAGKTSENADSASGLNEKDTSLTDSSEALNNTKELKQKLKDHIRYQSDTFRNGGLTSDKVKLGLPGWKSRYYEVKFSAKTPSEMEQCRKSLVEKYTEGLCWVLKYYFSEVPSWTWFYPFHYGPFASDLKGLTQVNVRFQKGLPLKPFEQLLAVLPPKSGDALPEAYSRLMVDDDSSILGFYPSSFPMDMDGKRFKWQAICKLPFIEEDRLLLETKRVEKELKDDERARNSESADRLFVGRSSGLGEQISSVFKTCRSFNQNDSIRINDKLSDGLSGFLNPSDEDQDIFCAFYKIHSDYVPKRHLLEGVDIPDKTISDEDLANRELWHEHYGNNTGRMLYLNQSHFQKASTRNKEPEILHKFAGTGRGFGRGKLDNSAIQTGPISGFKSYADCVGKSSSPSSSTSPSASSLNWRQEKQLNVSAPDNAGSRWRNTDKGPWQNTSTSNANPAWRQHQNQNRPFSSASSGQQAQGRGQNAQLNVSAPDNPGSRWRNTDKGAWQNTSTSNANPAWRQHQNQNRPFSSASTGQQSQGRGQYAHKPSNTFWNNRSRSNNNEGW